MALRPWHKGVIFSLTLGVQRDCIFNGEWEVKRAGRQAKGQSGRVQFAGSSLYSIQDCSTKACLDWRLGFTCHVKGTGFCII